MRRSSMPIAWPTAALAQGARAARKGDREGLVAALTRIDKAGAAVDASGIAC